MELADYLKVIRRRWWMILLAMVLCAVGAGAMSLTQAPRYTAQTRLLVSGNASDSTAGEVAGRELAAQRASAYAVLIDTGPALQAVTEAARAQGDGIAVTATADGTTPFIVISVTAATPRAAQAVANSYVTVLPRVIQRLELTPSSTPPTLSTLEAAPLPGAATSPKPKQDVLIGLVIGLVLGLGFALARDSLDARVRDSSEIEKLTEATLLGTVPKELAGEILPAMSRPRSGRAEAYRHVRTNLEFTSAEGMPRSITVTSAAPGEGKSSVATNLAVVAARSGRQVVIVDADLRKPTVAKCFGVQSSVGLADVLAGRWTWQEAVVPVDGENVSVLTSGPMPRLPSELVGSAAMARLIEELEDHYDLVIIDTPPVLPVSDALVIGVNTGGVVVVARMVETRRAALKRAVDAVRKVNANLLGVVGNAAVRREEKAYGEGYGSAYGYISDAPVDPTLFRGDQLRPAGRREAATPATDGSRPSRAGRHAHRDATQPADAPRSPSAESRAAEGPLRMSNIFPQERPPEVDLRMPPRQTEIRPAPESPMQGLSLDEILRGRRGRPDR